MRVVTRVAKIILWSLLTFMALVALNDLLGGVVDLPDFIDEPFK